MEVRISQNTSPTRKRVVVRTRPRFQTTRSRFGLVLRRQFGFCVLLAIIFAPFDAARADTIWLDGKSSPMFGIVESSDDQSIVFKKTSDGSTFESVTISKDRISSVVVNFDAQRLSSLVHGRWQPWQDYAEELHSQKQDPVARNLAIRLLVIVADNAKETRQRNAALNDLISLARNAAERENLLTLRYLETGQKRPEKQVGQTTNLPSPESREAAVKLVRSIRLRRDVSQQLASEQLKETVSAFKQVCSWQELIKIANSNRIDAQGLHRLVALELELRMAGEESKASNTTGGSWHLQANRISNKTISLPTIGSATGFDPDENRFVDGRWKK